MRVAGAAGVVLACPNTFEDRANGVPAQRDGVFANGKNLCAGRIHFARAFQSLTVTIKMTTPDGVVIFMVTRRGLEPRTFALKGRCSTN